MLGQTLANRYKIEAELGRGGVGVVYRGYDDRLNRPVAIKFLSSPELSDEDRTHLLSEAQAAAQLNHPNVVTVYDALESEGLPFIVMEYVEGRTLRSIPKPTVNESIEYMRQICSALAHAHSKGIIHRDLKPENALLTRQGFVKLMDFGLARRIDAPRVTKTNTLTGTFAFMAPELLQGEAPSPQSDLYALGIMLYEFLTGKSPFETNNLAKLIDQHLHEAAVPPREMVSGLPAGLNELVVQMLDKKPEKRPSSAHMVETILLAFQTERDITLPVLLDQLGVHSLDELADSRAPERAKWERAWKRKSYPRAAIPALETGEKEQILANRARELAKSVQHLEEHRLLLITGMPGIGKSTLARTLLEFMPPESPPPFWYNFERQQSSGNTLGVLLDRISGYLENILGSEVREEILSFRNSPEHQASTYDVDVLIDALNQPTPLWLIFDNFEVILSQGGERFLDEGLEMLFSGLKHLTHNAKIIISGLFVPRLNNGEFLLEFGSRPLTLQGLDEKFAVEYLRAHGLEKFPYNTLATIARQLDGHPFALNHAAHYVEALGVQDALKNLQGGLEEFSERFKLSLHQRLPSDEFSALQDLSVLKREISLEGLCQIAQTKPAIIKRLREEGLLETGDTGEFWLPTIVRESLKEENSETARDAHLRAAQFYRTKKRILAPRKIDDVADVLEWHYHAIHAGDIKNGFKAIFDNRLIDQFKDWNEFALSAELCENILSKVQPHANPLSRMEWIQLNHKLGEFYSLLGKIPENIGYLQVALDALTDSDPPTLRADILLYLAEAYSKQGELEHAMQTCEQAMKLLQDGLIFAKGLQLRGILYRKMGNYTQATETLEEARKIYESHNHLTGVAYATGELGIVYYYLNQFPQALENYRRAKQACEEEKNSRGATIGHINIGDVLLQQRQYEAARIELVNGLELARKKKLPREELAAGLYLTEAHIALGDFERAQSVLDSLQPLLVDSTSACIVGQAIRLQAALHGQTGVISKAMEKFEQALDILQAPECGYELARTQLDFAYLLNGQGQFEAARRTLEQAERGFIAINNQLGLQAVSESQQKMEAG